MERQFPLLEIHMPHLRQNMEAVIGKCTQRNIRVCGVIKGCSGMPEVANLFRQCGCNELGSSRIEEIIRCREAGIPGPYLLLRIPMISELEDVIQNCDI